MFGVCVPCQIFFDDNIRYTDAKIVDARSRIQPSKALNIHWLLQAHLVRAEPLEAIIEADYFIHQVRTFIHSAGSSHSFIRFTFIHSAGSSHSFIRFTFIHSAGSSHSFIRFTFIHSFFRFARSFIQQVRVIIHSSFIASSFIHHSSV
jgi:hypothetical protein